VFETRVQDRPSPNGFVFRDYSASSLLAAVQRALDSFANHEQHLQRMQNCLEQENDWRDRILEYEALYNMAMQDQQQAIA
jgi:glycogen synthase